MVEGGGLLLPASWAAPRPGLPATMGPPLTQAPCGACSRAHAAVSTRGPLCPLIVTCVWVVAWPLVSPNTRGWDSADPNVRLPQSVSQAKPTRPRQGISEQWELSLPSRPQHELQRKAPRLAFPLSGCSGQPLHTARPSSWPGLPEVPVCRCGGQGAKAMTRGPLSQHVLGHFCPP